MNKYTLFLLLLIPGLSIASEPTEADPCANLLAALNRPTNGDSVCVVKSGKIILEGGFQYQALYPGEGHATTYPNSQVRFGLPSSNEISILLPSFIRQYGTETGTNSGLTAPTAGLKHQFPNIDNWSMAAEGLFTLPTGSAEFGSKSLGFTAAGIVSYDITDTVSTTLMLSYSTQTTSSSEGGNRFNSINPDFVFTWECRDDIQLYAEVYAQTKTGYDQSDGYNADTGIQYLVTKNIELDIEYGQRLGGQLDEFAHYVGAGGGLRF
jgi:hypothetical protein